MIIGPFHHNIYPQSDFLICTPSLESSLMKTLRVRCDSHARDLHSCYVSNVDWLRIWVVWNGAARRSLISWNDPKLPASQARNCFAPFGINSTLLQSIIGFFLHQEQDVTERHILCERLCDRHLTSFLCLLPRI